MRILSTTISVGARTPFHALHLSDTHLTHADERDDERKNILAAQRTPPFHMHEENLALATAYARQGGMPILHTGDLIDFVSHKNLDRVHALTAENDFFVAAGNHEFSQYVGEAWEDEAYRNQSLARVQAAYTNDIRYDVREYNGVNFVALDNSYYLVDAWQLARLKETVAKGKPVVLLMHTPLYTPALYEYMMKERHSPCAYLMAAPEECLAPYPPDRYRQQRADDVTREAYDYIVGEKAIRAILTGHLHFDREDPVTDTLTQYVIGVTSGRDITFV